MVWFKFRGNDVRSRCDHGRYDKWGINFHWRMSDTTCIIQRFWTRRRKKNFQRNKFSSLPSISLHANRDFLFHHSLAKKISSFTSHVPIAFLIISIHLFSNLFSGILLLLFHRSSWLFHHFNFLDYVHYFETPSSFLIISKQIIPHTKRNKWYFTFYFLQHRCSAYLMSYNNLSG